MPCAASCPASELGLITQGVGLWIGVGVGLVDPVGPVDPVTPVLPVVASVRIAPAGIAALDEPPEPDQVPPPFRSIGAKINTPPFFAVVESTVMVG
jgi:hypothetical protein